MDIAQLNEKHALSGHISFSKGKGNLPVALIENQFAKSEISLYGAQVLTFQPHGQKPVLWMSETSEFEAGKPIRGGIPVCFPWFGPHVEDSQKPTHGFARLLTWTVKETAALANGGTELRLNLESTSATEAIWPFKFQAEMIIAVGQALEVSLQYTNTGNETFVCSDALHSYFNISNISKIDINRLEGTSYYAGFDKDKLFKQTEALLLIQNEENRRYIDHISDCIIDDFGYDRKIRVAKKGSKVTVVWNPWESAKNFSDMVDDGYKTMICVEAVNAYNDMVSLAPGKTFSVSTKISVE
jgi:glucose-6-phosphate 1-epimerase